ncbi:MAG: DUF808 domain-containing protein [Candidatus Eremiobacteraeota bacterium]|nr:DUF808 domain-containing protein [Candidatus Eremiobacteraeota bacterium]MCW5869864.1 DUF808 domain-containing protein [Candidatus Eremiobacteraeota bacterium]
MPVGSLLTLLDDMTAILDDVWIMTKLSAKKTAGVLGDDLALNAEQAVGLSPDRELPVIWAVAKGSARNKAMLIPLALVLRALAPWLIQPLLMGGGLFLCYEGAEKLLHRFGPQAEHQPAEALRAEDKVAGSPWEKEKIAGAVRTDLILSAEIIALTLGLVAHLDFARVLLVLLVISLLMTVGVYGLVGLIVKLDDIGLALQKRRQAGLRTLGKVILATAPRMLALISWLGTVAIFCVGGGILVHGVAPLHHLVEELNAWLGLLAEGVTGLVAGFVALAVVKLLGRLKGRATP